MINPPQNHAVLWALIALIGFSQAGAIAAIICLSCRRLPGIPTPLGRFRPRCVLCSINMGYIFPFIRGALVEPVALK
ncbi:MAG: hypothetical protein ACR2P5_04640 [Gammaproteobacteria bacterium]